MITFDDAFSAVCLMAGGLSQETVSLEDAHGRVLAEPIVAKVNSPPADVSAMDGYALRDADLAALPARLPVRGKVFAGAGLVGHLDPGSAVRIFTGARIPPGADRVIMQENVRTDGDCVVIEGEPGAARHIRTRASDFVAGTVLLESGTRLGYRQMVAAAGADLAKLTVWRQPRVIILGTGDELARPGTASHSPGSIPESVSYGIAALVADWGGNVLEKRRLPDDLRAMKKAAAEVLAHADLIVVTGGASVGEKDFAKTMFEDENLEIVFAKVAIKPGKPVWLGRAKNRLVMGLPGNPTSALVTGRLLLAPLVSGLSGMDPRSALQWRKERLATPIPGCGNRETFVRARNASGFVDPALHQDSSSQRTLADSDLLIRQPVGAPARNAGEEVCVLNF